jgi:hypothetical protein
MPVFLKVPRAKIGDHKIHSRNHGNEADVVIALPGSSETSDEIEQAVAYEHPTIIHDFWTGRFPTLWDWGDVVDAIAYVRRAKRRERRRAKRAKNMKRGVQARHPQGGFG